MNGRIAPHARRCFPFPGFVRHITGLGRPLRSPAWTNFLRPTARGRQGAKRSKCIRPANSIGGTRGGFDLPAFPPPEPRIPPASAYSRGSEPSPPGGGRKVCGLRPPGRHSHARGDFFAPFEFHHPEFIKADRRAAGKIGRFFPPIKRGAGRAAAEACRAGAPDGPHQGEQRCRLGRYRILFSC
jgi:hypothetical protein